MMIPGRTCPIDYSLSQDIFDKVALKECSTLYVVGGLYGNLEAFKALNTLAKNDNNPLIIFNGDMHWFDKSLKDFMAIENMASPHLPLLGNVEAELKRDTDIGAGCGCSYPKCVSDEDVNRSNMIHRELKSMISFVPNIKESLKTRESIAIVNVSDKKVAITHGDEKSLAGWGCSRESLMNIERQSELNNWMKKYSIDIFATTHTCAPVCTKLSNGIVINNGAAGMPNFKNSHFGLITRISSTKHHDALYRGKIGEVYVEALPLKYDNQAFIKWFDSLWPKDSAASISYRNRIVSGPNENIDTAILSGFYKI